MTDSADFELQVKALSIGLFGGQMTLPWDEKVATISINPDMAGREDIAKLAAELMEANQRIQELEKLLDNQPTLPHKPV